MILQEKKDKGAGTESEEDGGQKKKKKKKKNEKSFSFDCFLFFLSFGEARFLPPLLRFILIFFALLGAGRRGYVTNRKSGGGEGGGD